MNNLKMSTILNPTWTDDPRVHREGDHWVIKPNNLPTYVEPPPKTKVERAIDLIDDCLAWVRFIKWVNTRNAKND
jgi:hypothetical protein